MHTFGATLEAALRDLALALAEADNRGVDTRAVRLGLQARWPDRMGDAAIVEDVVLAASALLAGVDPDLPGLIELWGASDPTRTAAWASRLVPTLRPHL